MSSLNIIENSANLLVAEQSPPSVLFFGLLSTLVALVAAGAVFSQRKWILGAFMLLLAAGLALMMLPGAAYRITVDRTAHTVAWEARRSGTVEAQGSLPVASIQSADFDFNRNARNIILIGRDGKQYLPLGDQHFTGEPEQSVVLSAIRELIGQSADSPSAPQKTH